MLQTRGSTRQTETNFLSIYQLGFFLFPSVSFVLSLSYIILSILSVIVSITQHWRRSTLLPSPPHLLFPYFCTFFFLFSFCSTHLYAGRKETTKTTTIRTKTHIGKNWVAPAIHISIKCVYVRSPLVLNNYGFGAVINGA